MLDDRSYMREPNYGSQRSATMTLIYILIGVFVIQSFVLRFSSSGAEIYHRLSMTNEVLSKGHIWQLLTFQFLHAPFGYGGMLHILFNCFGLYMFGMSLEQNLGSKGFLKLYFFAGTFGGLFHALGNFVAPDFFPAPVVGASAGVTGLVAASAIFFPTAQISVFMLFPIPARVFLVFMILFSIFGILTDRSRVAHGAHLGGILAALVYVRWVMHLDWKMPSFSFPKRQPKVITGGLRSSGQSEPTEANEVNSAEIDAILDKISAHGIQSLTEKERQKLQAARSKMARR
ncbi:MAG: rhomboid family intramembrane serine protease [Verrucomicrobiales bacterium]